MEQRGEYEIAVKLYDLIDVSINPWLYCNNHLGPYVNFILNSLCYYLSILSFQGPTVEVKSSEKCALGHNIYHKLWWEAR